MYLMCAEYLAWNHLLKLIPEASLYFMEAVLSEPPISQGQRRRIIYLLDILNSGEVFVMDEPTANLDEQTYLQVFEDLVVYAREEKASVIVLEPKVYPKVFELLQEKGVLGNIYSFFPDPLKEKAFLVRAVEFDKGER
jgi:hypothetical protein